MADITTIEASDLISESRETINDNFAALNEDKLESGDTATSLTVSGAFTANTIYDQSDANAFAFSAAGFGLYFRQDNLIHWATGNSWSGTYDVGLGRSSTYAGTLEVSDATTGALRDLRCRKILTTLTTPASASASGVAGTIVADANYIYVCVATDTWKRVAITTW